jgi:hypothetical protein
MTKVCERCGASLGLFARLGGKQLCGGCAPEVDRERERYRELLDDLVSGARSLETVGAELSAAETDSYYEPKQVAELKKSAARVSVEQALADDILTEDENEQLEQTLRVLDLTTVTDELFGPDLFARFVVARANAGHLPGPLPPGDYALLAKPGEVVYMETPAQLLKEVTKREYKAGYQGASFRIAKGVRYHTGGARGHSVVVGTELQTADTGILSVSSDRAVFLGDRSTIDMPYTKFAGLHVYTDGLRFNLSNRKTAPLLRVPNGEVVAAVINGAAQEALS